jgi:hypothetical protein
LRQGVVLGFVAPLRCIGTLTGVRRAVVLSVLIVILVMMMVLNESVTTSLTPFFLEQLLLQQVELTQQTPPLLPRLLAALGLALLGGGECTRIRVLSVYLLCDDGGDGGDRGLDHLPRLLLLRFASTASLALQCRDLILIRHPQLLLSRFIVHYGAHWQLHSTLHSLSLQPHFCLLSLAGVLQW